MFKLIKFYEKNLNNLIRLINGNTGNVISKHVDMARHAKKPFLLQLKNSND